MSVGPFTSLQPAPNIAKYKEMNLYLTDLSRWFASIHKILGTVDGGIGWMNINQVEATEGVQDIVGQFIEAETTDGTIIGVVPEYNDTTGKVQLHITKEDVQETVVTLLLAGSTSITLTYDDPANTLTISVSDASSTIKGVVKQAVAVADVTGTAGATYTATEQTMINDLKAQLNSLMANLRTSGALAT
jgi:hypothetical protein